MKQYIVEYYSPDTYKVKVSEYKKDVFKDYREHIVSFKKEWLCDCKGFYYRRTCNHLKWVLSQLKEGGGIIRFDNKETWHESHFVKRCKP